MASAVTHSSRAVPLRHLRIL